MDALSGLVPATRSPAAVRQYWTAERMADAIPLGPLADTSAKRPRSGKRQEGVAKQVKHVTQSPERTHGKVFFRSGLFDYVCSGTSVDAPSGRLVWTAGHCVYEPGDGGYVTNWEFVPAYKGGRKPFGEWPATGLGATSQWRNSGGGCIPGGIIACGDVRFDLAAATVSRNGQGKTLRSVVGSRGIAFNQGRDQLYRGYGYPAEGDFNGEHMFRCKSHHAGDDHGMGSPEPLKFNCDMTGGSSGGGWVADGDVLSVVSYGYNGDSKHLYGPYQGSAARSFYNQVKNG